DYFYRLRWQSASQSLQTVPNSQLYYQLPSSVTTTYYPILGTCVASMQTIYAGQSTSLVLSSTNASAASIDHSVGSVAVNSTTSVSPTTTTTYTVTLTATNAA